MIYLNTYEQLLQDADDAHVTVHEAIDLNGDTVSSKRLDGLYIDNHIALDSQLKTTAEKTAILAEEIGHHFTSVGDVTDLKDAGSRQQELDARLWGYNRLIGLRGIIRAFEHHCQNRYEMAEYLDVPEDYLEEALSCYRSKYGVYTLVDNYTIYFIPNISVMKLF